MNSHWIYCGSPLSFLVISTWKPKEYLLAFLTCPILFLSLTHTHRTHNNVIIIPEFIHLRSYLCTEAGREYGGPKKQNEVLVGVGESKNEALVGVGESKNKPLVGVGELMSRSMIRIWCRESSPNGVKKAVRAKRWLVHSGENADEVCDSPLRHCNELGCKYHEFPRIKNIRSVRWSLSRKQKWRTSEWAYRCV